VIPIKFNLKDIFDLDVDLKQSVKSLPVIVQRVLTIQLRQLRNEMRPLVARGTSGKLQRSFGSSVRRQRGNVLATFGFLTKGVSGRTVVAGNVQQKGSATPRKAGFLWIPLPANQNISPRDFFNAQNTFIRTTTAGNKVAYIRSGDQIVPLFVLKKRVQLSRPPLPIEQKVEGQLPEIQADIVETIAQIIEARKAALSVDG
jgi:hypothetical protein